MEAALSTQLFRTAEPGGKKKLTPVPTETSCECSGGKKQALLWTPRTSCRNYGISLPPTPSQRSSLMTIGTFHPAIDIWGYQSVLHYEIGTITPGHLKHVQHCRHFKELTGTSIWKTFVFDSKSTQSCQIPMSLLQIEKHKEQPTPRVWFEQSREESYWVQN